MAHHDQSARHQRSMILLASIRHAWARTLATIVLGPNDQELVHVPTIEHDVIGDRIAAFTSPRSTPSVCCVLDLCAGCERPVYHALALLYSLRTNRLWVGPFIALVGDRATCRRFQETPLFGTSRSTGLTLLTLARHHRVLVEPLVLTELQQALLNTECMPSVHAWLELRQQGPLDSIRARLKRIAEQLAATRPRVDEKQWRDLHELWLTVSWRTLLYHGGPLKLAHTISDRAPPTSIVEARRLFSEMAEVIQALKPIDGGI